MPNPAEKPEAFNQFLRDNNRVVRESDYWLMIENSYESTKDNIQYVVFCKLNVKDMDEYYIHLLQTETFSDREDMFAEVIMILAANNNDNVYINAIEDRSIPERLHIHIKESKNIVDKIKTK